MYRNKVEKLCYVRVFGINPLHGTICPTPTNHVNPQFIKLAEVFSLRGGAQLEVSRHQWLRLVGPYHKDFEILGFRV